MVFAANQEKNGTQNFKDMLYQDNFRQLVNEMMVEVNSHKYKDHWTVMKQKEVTKDHYVNGQLPTIFSIQLFKRNKFPDGKLMKHKARLCAHGGMQKWGIHF